MDDTVRVGRETLVASEFGNLDRKTQTAVQTVIRSRYGDPAVAGLECLVGDDVRMGVAIPARLLPGHQRALRDVDQRGEATVEQRDLDVLSLAGVVAPTERGQQRLQ